MTAVLEDFLTSLAKRLADAADTQAAPPILAISEGIDSFLADDIAQHNEVFSKAWPADREMDEQRLVDAFIALVTAAHTFDSKLQKLFDKLVPRKVKSELVFWRRYFAHAHALLSRLAPLPDEMEHALLSRLPPPRPLKERRFKPKETLKSKGDLSREEILSALQMLGETLSSDETVAALGNECAAATADGVYPNVDTAAMKLCLAYQLELMESLGIEGRFGCLQLQPHLLAKRFPDMQGKDAPIFEALQRFMHACQTVAPRAQNRQSQQTSDDPSARRFAPAPKLEEQPEFDAKRLLKLVNGMKAFIESEETTKALIKVSEAEAKEAGGMMDQRAVQQCQQNMMGTVARWQREYFESQGVAQDAGMRAVWSIPENFKPTPRKSANDKPSDANELLQAFGNLRLSIHSALQGAMIDATKPEVKPVEERRFPPKADLQTQGPLKRAFVVKFTQKCVEVLLSPESLDILSSCGTMQEMGALSVRWQRELLEHLGVEMDHGCRALGEVPHRFHDDREVLQSFALFQSACGESAQKAKVMNEEKAKASKKAAKEKAVEVS